MTPQEEIDLLTRYIELFEETFTQLHADEQKRIWHYLQDRYITHASKQRHGKYGDCGKTWGAPQ